MKKILTKILTWLGITISGIIIILFVALTVLNFLPSSLQKIVSAKSHQILGIKTEEQTITSEKAADNTKDRNQTSAQKQSSPQTIKTSHTTLANTQPVPKENSNQTAARTQANTLSTYSAMLDPLTNGQIMKDYQNYIAQSIDGSTSEAQKTLSNVKNYTTPILNAKIPQDYQLQKSWDDLQTVIKSLIVSMENAEKYARVNNIPSMLDQTQLISKYALDANTKANQLQLLIKAQQK